MTAFGGDKQAPHGRLAHLNSIQVSRPPLGDGELVTQNYGQKKFQRGDRWIV